MRYSYPHFMPTGIVTRFIVIMHEYIDQQKYVWKSGVILKQNNTKAEIIEYYGRREITIRTSGANQRDLMTIISHQLDRISDSYQRLKYHKLIPCNCEECKTSPEPYFHPFDVLQKAKQKRQREVQCQTSFDMVDVRKLIDDVINYRDEELNPEDKYLYNSQYRSPVPVNIINNVSTNGNNQVSQDNRKSQVGNIGRDFKPQNSPLNSDNAQINNNTNPSTKKKLINWGIILTIIGIIASFTGGLMNPEIREKLGIDSPQPSPELPGNKN